MGDRFDLAIWLESDELSQVDQGNGNDDEPASDSSGIHVHLNFWKLPKCNAIDIGINFPLFTHGSVNLFINTNEEIVGTDITPDLKRDDIINTIFNEFISTASCPKQTACVKAERNSGQPTEPFCLCCLTAPIRTEEAYGGKIIKFNIATNGCDKTCGCRRSYIRIRLAGKGIENVYVRDVIPSSKFQHYTSRIDFLDFRLNNVRSLPGSLLEYKNVYPPLSSVRCFLMVESSEDLLLYNKSYKKVRAIEKEKWSSYLNCLTLYCGKKNIAILAYQWNVDNIEQDFSLFTKVKRSEFQIKPFALFILSGIALGVISSLIAQYIDKFFKLIFNFLSTGG